MPSDPEKWRSTHGEWEEIGPETRWRCLRCGKCCRRDWAINLTWAEYDRIRSDPRFGEMVIDTVKVDEGTGMSHPVYRIPGKCPLLDDKRSLCKVHPDRPYTCVAYPFLLMPDGKLMGHSECPGFGHGDPLDIEEISRMLIEERKKAGMRAE